MSMIGIGAAEYQIAGYQVGKTKSTVETGAKTFIETVAEKSAQDKVAGCGEKDEEQIRRMSETDFEERVLQNAGPNAPQSVKDAWMGTVKEVGVNGLGETKNGRTHITDMHMQQIIANYYGLLHSNDILGDSVESAIRATQKALYDFDHPLEPGKVRSMEEQQALIKEREFYTTFLEKLENLAGQNRRNKAVNIGGVSFIGHVVTKAAVQSYVLGKRQSLYRRH